MNASSLLVVAVVVVFAAFAVWRVLKKGMPCECGSSCCCRGGCHCNDGSDLVKYIQHKEGNQK